MFWESFSPKVNFGVKRAKLSENDENKLNFTTILRIHEIFNNLVENAIFACQVENSS